MKLLVLLALTGLATASDFELGDRIVATEEECARIYKLNENWSTSNFHEQAVQYVDLYLICRDSLNEDKYAYIDKNQVDMSWYPKENDMFPVITSEGEKYVTKPPQRKPNDEESMKKRLTEYLTTTGGRMNPIFRLMSMQSEMSQVIIDKQVECEVLTLFILKHPDDKDSEAKHADCMNKLNCLKEKFMKDHGFTRSMYPNFFPVLYKRKGTVIKTPPQLEKSVCETPDSPEGHKRELEKWMNGIEYIGEKIADVGEAGTDFIANLVKKGMGGGDKVLTRDELNELMTDVQSVTISDDDDDDEEDDENTYKVYGDVMLSKLAELEAKGIQIAQAKLDKAKPAVEKVENIVSATGQQLKKIEEMKIKPAIKKTAQGLNHAESNIKEKSIAALGEVKDGLTAAGNVAKAATFKAKGEGSILMNKLMTKPYGDADSEDHTGVTDVHDQLHEIASIQNSQGWLSSLIDRMIHPEYLPNNYDNMQQPTLLNILKEMGGRDVDGKDKMPDAELVKMLKTLKENTKQRAKDLHLKKEEVKQSAEVVKGVMHALLFAASHGFGAAKDMNSQEIDTAKSLVDQLVDYATAEVLDEVYEKEEDEELNEEDSHEEQKDVETLPTDKENQKIEEASITTTDDVPQHEQTTEATSGEMVYQDSENPIADQKPDQTASNIAEEDNEDVSDSEAINNEKNEDIPIPEKNMEVPDIK